MRKRPEKAVPDLMGESTNSLIEHGINGDILRMVIQLVEFLCLPLQNHWMICYNNTQKNQSICKLQTENGLHLFKKKYF